MLQKCIISLRPPVTRGGHRGKMVTKPSSSHSPAEEGLGLRSQFKWCLILNTHWKLDVCYIIMNGVFLLSPCLLAQTIPFFKHQVKVAYGCVLERIPICHLSARWPRGSHFAFLGLFLHLKNEGVGTDLCFSNASHAKKFAQNTNSWTFRSTRLETFFFFWPHQATSKILIPRPGIEPRLLAVKALSPKHWNSQKPVFFTQSLDNSTVQMD